MSMGPNSFRMPQMPKFNFGVNLPTPSPQLQNALSRVPAVDPRMAFGGTAGRGVPASAIPAAALGALSFGSTVPRAAPAMPQIPAAIQAPQLQPQPDFGVFKPATAPAIPMPTMRPAAPARPNALLESGSGFTTLRLSDGTVQRREGDRGSRNNNPGNLTGSDKAVAKYGAIARDHGGNLIFATPELGQLAMNRFILDENGDKTVAEMLETYAPGPKRNPVTGALEPVANDPFDTNKTYPAQLAAMGINLNQTINTMTEDQKRALVGAMRGVEGNKGYTVAGERGGILGGDEGGFGLLADPRATGAVEVASGAAATAEARIDQGKAKPLSAAERRRFGPENLGMIAFGLSLLGGEDVTTAMNNGLNVYSMFEGMDDAKEQQDAIDAAIAQMPPEQQELARALAETNPDLFSQNIAQRLSGGSSLQGALQEYVDQGLMTPEQAELVAMMEQTNPEAAVKRAGEIVDASNETFKVDQTYTRNVTESTDKVIAFAERSLQLLREIRPALLQETNGDEGLVKNLLQQASDTGLAFAASDRYPLAGTKAKQLAALLKSNEAENAFGRLQQMRDESPTGGALGPVSNYEIEFLISAGGNLGFGQGAEALEGQLMRIIERAQNLQQSRVSQFQDYYAARGGNLLPVAKQAAAAPAGFGMSDEEFNKRATTVDGAMVVPLDG